MILLQKVFNLRDKANPDHEKPFLEHLEDLRIMITRIVLTLVIAMIGCFALQDHLMTVLRKPVEEVWAVYAADSLPDELPVADWEAAKKIEHSAAALDLEDRQAFLANYDAAVIQQTQAVALLRATLLLPEEQQAPFLDQACGDDQELRSLLNQLIEEGAQPGIDVRGTLEMMSALKPTETFMLSMKLSFFAGIVVSFPLLLFYIFQFVLPGLHDNEKKMLWPAMAIGFGLFLSGVFFAYYVVLPRALAFFFSWDQSLGVASDWRIGWYISFATQFTLLFGLSFELPVVVMVFVKLGLLNYDMMQRTRSYAVLAIVVIAAAITPTSDLITLSLMAIPMYLLYEACIWLAWLDRKKAREREEEEERERLSYLLDEDNQDSSETDSADEDHGEYDHSDYDADHADYHSDHDDYDHGEYDPKHDRAEDEAAPYEAYDLTDDSKSDAESKDIDASDSDASDESDESDESDDPKQPKD